VRGARAAPPALDGDSRTRDDAPVLFQVDPAATAFMANSIYHVLSGCRTKLEREGGRFVSG
jgi:hypothetical protein